LKFCKYPSTDTVGGDTYTRLTNLGSDGSFSYLRYWSIKESLSADSSEWASETNTSGCPLMTSRLP
jgi:hypothetical protein